MYEEFQENACMESFKRAPVWRVSRGCLYREFLEGACMDLIGSDESLKRAPEWRVSRGRLHAFDLTLALSARLKCEDYLQHIII